MYILSFNILYFQRQLFVVSSDVVQLYKTNNKMDIEILSGLHERNSAALQSYGIVMFGSLDKD